MARNTRQFYIVWNPEELDETKTFETLDEARDAAREMAKRSPGDDFFVCRAIWWFTSIDVTETKLENADDGV